MERNTSTFVGDLKTGDRFYKAGDKSKTVMILVEHKRKVTKFQTYHYFGLEAAVFDRLAPQSRDDFIERFAKPLKANTAVIFLRSSENT